VDYRAAATRSGSELHRVAAVERTFHRTRREAPVPYDSIKDLPKAQTDQYNHHQKEAFLKGFNSAKSAYKEYDGDEPGVRSRARGGQARGRARGVGLIRLHERPT
jgi:hypothetical protein